MTTKRPNAFLYFLIYILFYPVLKICFSLKVDKSRLELPDGPYIVLANHATLYDFLIVMLSLWPRRLNAVTAHKFFLYRPLHKFLPIMGCIPKNMFDPDVRSIIGMKQVLKRGGAILLFPEGRCSIGGKFSAIHKSTGKLLKKLAVPIISSHIEGAATCAPLWRKGVRYGQVRITHQNLFSTGDLEAKTAEEINAAIAARFSGADESSPPREPLRTHFSRNPALGLDSLLYYCPRCESEFKTTAEHNTIHCTACGFSALMDKYGQLHPSDSSAGITDISSWYEKQMLFETRALSDGMEPIVFDVSLKTPAQEAGGGLELSGHGTMRIDPKGWHYDGVLHGEQASLLFPVDAIPAITFDYNKNIQISYNNKYYVFVPADVRKCIKYTIIAECLHRKFAAHPLLV